MATIVDYDYVPEISTQDALHNLTSDVTTGYDTEIPWVNTYKINAEVSTYNFPEWWWSWIAGWSTDVHWSSNSSGVSWTSGNVNLPDWSQISITSWSVAVSTNTYLYVDMQDGSVYSTTTARDAVWTNKIMLCAAFPSESWKNVSYQAFGCGDQSSLTTWANIAARTIVASNIATGEITANEIAANTITSSEIKTGSIDADRLDVSELSAISADLGTITAWDITGTTITAGSTSSWWIMLYPYSSSAWRIEFYYWGDMVWYMQWLSWGVWWAIAVSWDYFYLDTTVLCAGKLRIPVWTNLYN